ncbi:MAG: hypothetical protein RID25_13965 [Cyclobacteriaceae bacterium]
MKPLLVYADKEEETVDSRVPLKVNRDLVVLHLCLTDSIPYRYEIFEDFQEAVEFCRQMPGYSMKGVALYFSENSRLKKEFFKIKL